MTDQKTTPITIDLHTHSAGSRDGGITLEQYRTLLDDNRLDYIAITDHDGIAQARHIHDKLGERIIIGEEISTTEGDLIGLYLKKPVPAGLSAKKTVRLIKEQDGLVYLPHPFETIRHGLDEATMDTISEDIDIVETCNGRAFAQNRSERALLWAKLHQKPAAASSDAHGIRGIGATYTTIHESPTRTNLPKLLERARLTYQKPPKVSLLYPKYHTIKKKFIRS